MVGFLQRLWEGGEEERQDDDVFIVCTSLEGAGRSEMSGSWQEVESKPWLPGTVPNEGTDRKGSIHCNLVCIFA